MMHSGNGSPRASSTRRNRALAPLVAFLALVAGCTAAPVASRAPAAHGTPSAARVARRSPSPVAPVRTAGPIAARVARPKPRAIPSIAALPQASPTPAGTHIYSVRATPNVVHGGDRVRWDVRTSPDIVSVAAHVSAVTLPMNRLSVGHFGLSFAVPSDVPFFFHGVYDLDVRALTASGETLHRGVELTFQ